MKLARPVSAALISLALAPMACQTNSGAPVLTPVGPSKAEMTASATPPTASLTVPPPPAQRSTPPLAAPAQVIPITASSATPTIITVTPCGPAWFASGMSPGSCPDSPPAQLEAAYQTFEHGAILWRKTRGYIILPFNPAAGVQSGIVSLYPDRVTVYRDTSGGVSPPAGLRAPVSGFGLVWRGDIFEEPGFGFQTTLGWATADETGYTVTEQTGSQAVIFNGGTSLSLISIFTLPDGRILHLSRLANPNQMWSINFLSP